ncbi:MAG: response regulator [Acidobacteriota bacterium]|nr:response regulator [Acidobacteriota bacterium]
MTGDAAEILLVEDDPHDVELTLRAFRSENAHTRIDVVRDGEEALDYLFCRGSFHERSADQPPHLILLDLKLPKIGGFQVLHELKNNPASAWIPVIVLTSSGEYRDIAESYRLGVNSYIQKPVDVAEFRRAIRALTLYWLGFNRLPVPAQQRISPRAAPLQREASAGFDE